MYCLNTNKKLLKMNKWKTAYKLRKLEKNAGYGAS
jgi:hypothetical protein